MRPQAKPVEEKSYARLFFLMSLALVLALAWAVYDETVTRRPWKSYQRKFLREERERLEKEQEQCTAALQELALRAELQKLEAALARAKERLRGPEYQAAEAELEKATGKAEELQRELTFLRSERDAAYYVWKRNSAGPADDGPAKAKYEELERRVAEKERELSAAEARVKDCRVRMESLEGPLQELSRRKEELTGGCATLQEKKQNLARQKPAIKQVVIPELGAVDRCVTCHPAVDTPGRDRPEISNPFRTHPQPDIFLGKTHPLGRFGCTACHHGKGSLLTAPRGKPFQHGREDPFWPRPLLKKPFTESSCRTCHPEEWELPGASHYTAGKKLFADLGCYACHLTPGFEKSRRIGPRLHQVAQKISPDYLAAWLADPARLRPATRMPNSWPLSEEAGSAAARAEEKNRDQETAAVAAFLLDASTGEAIVEPTDRPGDASRGKKLFMDKGCVGCHRPGQLRLPPLQDTPRLPDYGPELSDLGQKIQNPAWVPAFLAAPAAFSPETRMPNPLLSAAETADLAAYLLTLSTSQPLPPAPTLSSPEQIRRGRELVSAYGCYGCHEIPGFENAVRGGPDLAGFGDKPVTQLSFGNTLRDPWQQTWSAWTRLKLKSPRLFATERIRLQMPSNSLTEAQLLDLSVFLLSLRTENPRRAYFRSLSEVEKGKAAADRLIAEYNCRGCHLVEGQGGDIREFIRDPGLVPPDLTGEGAKTQPAWLFQFLKQPSTLRPWMSMRMPRFPFSDDQANALVAYFMARAKKSDFFVEVPVSMDPGLMAQTAQVFVRLKCLQCHQLTAGPALKYSDLAPDMALTRQRLRPDWMENFLLNPQHLQPGTRMPTYFPREDDEDPESLTTPLPEWLSGKPRDQILAIRDYLYLLKSQDEVPVANPNPRSSP